ncbi:MAG: pyrimidine utilization protein D [Acinetobacter tandoii]|uniref:pyrimidine utilization protein D n=1 Tax=Acinetobacter tandoii TaxID=202954 RepID=UPI003D6A4849
MLYQVFPSQKISAEYIILSAGLGGHGQFWTPQIKALQQHFHVVIYDQEGCHKNAAILDENYSMSDLAKQVMDLLSILNIQEFHFVGHALGGFIGAELAILLEKSEKTMLSLTVINGWQQLDAHTHKCFSTRIALLQYVGVEAYVRAQALFLYPPAWISAHISDLEIQENKQIEQFPPLINVFTRLKALMRYELEAETISSLNKIPLYLIATEDDFLVPYQQSYQLKQLFPHAELDVLPHGAHAVTVTQAEIFNQLLLEKLVKKSAEKLAAS